MLVDATGQTFVRRKGRADRGPDLRRPADDGLISPPRVIEDRWDESLLYPLWNASGLGVLAFMPIALWFATVPLFGILPALISGTAFALLGTILLVPQFLALVVAGGYTLIFLGQILVTSCLGELCQPRSPGWSLSEIAEGLGRWFWASLIGGVVGGLPAMIYWINCGDLDWIDWIILVDLIIPGLAYAQLALLGSLVFETPLAANPVIVIAAIRRLGWAYVSPCLATGIALVSMIVVFEAVMRIRDPFGQAVAFWALWVVSLYASMVVLRIFGLFCYRHAANLGWAVERYPSVS